MLFADKILEHLRAVPVLNNAHTPEQRTHPTHTHTHKNNNNNNKLLYSHISKKHIDSTTVKHK